VLVQLYCIEIIAQESTNVLEDTVSWLQEVDPREKVQDQVVLESLAFWNMFNWE
jgi:hypothetical protein